VGLLQGPNSSLRYEFYAQNVSMHLCVIKHPEIAVSRTRPLDSLSFMDIIVSTGTYRLTHCLVQVLGETFVHKTGIILRVNLNQLSTNFLTLVLVDLWVRLGTCTIAMTLCFITVIVIIIITMILLLVSSTPLPSYLCEY